jgi:hypothetical protein
MVEESGLAAVVGMNMLSGPYGFCGFADGHAIFDDSVPLCNFLAGNFMAKRYRLLEHEAVACDQHIGLKVQQSADVVFGMNGEADATHTILE